MTRATITAAIWIVICFYASLALAQAPAPDPDFLNRALVAMQGQRNQANDAAAVAEAKLSKALDDLAKAQARIKELETPQAKEAK